MANARNPNAAIVGPFNYSDKTHLSIYHKNVESLYSGDKTAEKFDLEPDKLQGFMALFGTRAKRCNWVTLLSHMINGATVYIVDRTAKYQKLSSH